MDGAVKREFRVFADPAALSRAAAEESARLANESAQQRGRCTIALSGGHTPRALYELWAGDFREQIPWPNVHLFWGDERYVPPDDPQSNYRMVRQALLDRVGIPPANIHPVPTQLASPEEAAQEYEIAVRRIFPGAWPDFDLILLGTGPEGHTASLFPHSPALGEKARWVVSVRVPAEPPQRISFTLPVLNHARNVFFLLAGKEKQGIVERLRANPEEQSLEIPVSLVRAAGCAIWFVDGAAYGQA
jgi:6-phosphogluconolactonase